MSVVLDLRLVAQYPVGTVVLDFVQTGDYPPIPISDPNIFMAFTAPYSKRAGKLVRGIKALWASGDIAAQTALKWSSVPVEVLQLSAGWLVNPTLQDKQHKVVWSANWPMINRQVEFSWGGYSCFENNVKTSWTKLPQIQQHLETVWVSSVTVLQSVSKTVWQHTELSDRAWDTFYNHGNDVKRGYTLPYGPKPPSYICSNDYRPQTGTIVLNFTELAAPATGSVELNFSNFGNPIVCVLDNGGGLIWPMPDLPTVDTTKPITPPRRRSYIMQPELRCYRVSDNQEVNIISANWSISRSQWGATISLQCGSKGDKDLLFAGGIEQEFKLVINGYEFYGLAESFNYSGEFGSNSYTVIGRSSVAALASPHASARSYSNATAKGIAALVSDELLGTGWNYQFDMTQFNVPAGVFSYVNKTPIEAIAQIAAAIGGMVYPDGATKTIYIRPQWPVAPWAIAAATPDVAVHDDVILSLSSSPASTPLYNAIFVRGEQQGVSAKVKRIATAGDKVAADVVDPLMVDSQALRQRGTAELANSGRKDSLQLTLPIMDLLPPLLPGQVLGITWQTETFKTLVDSIAINAQRSQNGQLTVRQNAGVIRSYE